MSSIVKNAAIIGAEPGGLATAIALCKRRINVRGYEQVKKFCSVGAGLGTMPNGFNLEAIEPCFVED